MMQQNLWSEQYQIRFVSFAAKCDKFFRCLLKDRSQRSHFVDGATGRLKKNCAERLLHPFYYCWTKYVVRRKRFLIFQDGLAHSKILNIRYILRTKNSRAIAILSWRDETVISRSRVCSIFYNIATVLSSNRALESR